MRTISTETHRQYERLAEQLALMPDVIARLLFDHAADDNGRCQRCTRGGTGCPAATHPCSLHQLALMALAVRKQRRSVITVPADSPRSQSGTAVTTSVSSSYGSTS